MRCTRCDYALWNTTERACPECGQPYQPSEYRFVPGRVRFRCPDCGEVYFGTSDDGHLVPPVFDCVGCDRRLAMDEMLLAPGEGVKERDTSPGRLPWLERRHRGVLKAFFQTIGMALVKPHRLMHGVPADASVGESLVYGVGTTIAFFSAAPSPR